MCVCVCVCVWGGMMEEGVRQQGHEMRKYSKVFFMASWGRRDLITVTGHKQRRQMQTDADKKRITIAGEETEKDPE